MKIKAKRVPYILLPQKRETCLQRVLAGGQIGVDIAALRAAKKLHIKTGGAIPAGFVTLDGTKPGYSWMYGLDDNYDNYKDRTWANVANATATIRIATNFLSRGETCTLNAIRFYRKPHKDIFWERDFIPSPEELAEWIEKMNIKILNVAGNADKKLEEKVEDYLEEVFTLLKWM